MTVITLTTDFGLRSGFVGIMKGVIYGIAPQVKIVDISHASAAGHSARARSRSSAGAFLSCRHHHVYVVDPGVGTPATSARGRLAIIISSVRITEMLTPFIEEAEPDKKSVEFVHLNNPKILAAEGQPHISWRDVFAPVAPIWNRRVVERIRSRITDPVLLELPRPIKTEHGWTAHITVIDTLQLATDLPAAVLRGWSDIRVHLRGGEIVGASESYGINSPAT